MSGNQYPNGATRDPSAGLTTGADTAPRRRGRSCLAVGAAFLAASGIISFGLVAGANTNNQRNKMTATPDFSKTHAVSSAKLIQFTPSTRIPVGTAYFDEKLTATKIKYTIKSKPIDIMPDPTVNKELHDVGAIEFDLQGKAVTAKINPKTGKNDISIDGSKALVQAHWVNTAGPNIRDFTMNGNKPNFDDRAGGVLATERAFCANAKMLNVDTCSNTLDDVDKEANKAVSDAALAAMLKQCPRDPVLTAKTQAAIAAELSQMAMSMGGGKDDIGTITYTKPLSWSVVQEKVQLSGDAFVHSVSEPTLTVDEMNCSADKPAGIGG
jgi:hypothetical protein